MNGFDTRELTQFQKELLDLAVKKMPKESKQFLREEGTKLKRLTLKTAKSKVKKKKGNLFKGIRRGKVYNYKGNGALSVRVYGGKPAYHAGIIENGHRQVTKDGREVGFVEGKHPFEEAAKEFQGTYYNDTQEFIENLLDKGLS